MAVAYTEVTTNNRLLVQVNSTQNHFSYAVIQIKHRFFFSLAYLDDLHELIHPAVSREQRLPQQQLCRHAAQAPRVDGAGVVRRPKYKLGCSVVPDTRRVAVTQRWKRQE